MIRVIPLSAGWCFVGRCFVGWEEESSTKSRQPRQFAAGSSKTRPNVPAAMRPGTRLMFAGMLSVFLMMPASVSGQGKADDDPYGGDNYGSDDPFGNFVRTKVVLLMKDVDKQVARSWFNAYSLKQGQRGMGGGASLQNVVFDVDLEREPPESWETRVVMIVPKDDPAADVEKRFRIARRIAVKYGVEAEKELGETVLGTETTSVVQTVVSTENSFKLNFDFWEALARELAPQSPTIEVAYRQPNFDEYGTEGMDDMGMGDMMDMGGMGGGMMPPPQPTEPEPTGWVDGGEILLHWSRSKNRLAAVSRSATNTGTVGWIEVDVDLSEGFEQPVVAQGVSAVRVGDSVYAFSGARSRWDVLAVKSEDDWGIAVDGTMVKVEAGDDIHVFTASAGRWMSLSNASVQDDSGEMLGRDDAISELEKIGEQNRKIREQIASMKQTWSKAAEADRPKIREQLAGLLRQQDQFELNVRQLRGQTIIRQASQLIEDAKEAFEQSTSDAAIDAELDRVLTQ